MSAVRHEVALEVDATAALVWQLVSDVTRTGEWSPENLGGEWLSGTPRAVGARFRGRNRRGRATWSTTCEVVESEPGHVFAFAVGPPERPDAVWRYALSPLPDGRTLVRESFELPRPLGAAARLLTRLTTGVRDREADLVDGMRQTLARLADTARRDGVAPLT